MSEDLTDVERVLLQKNGFLPRLLFVLAGPSGVGKNTIIKKLLTNHPDEMGRVVTYTTRPPRKNEVEGVQYHFVSREQFRDLALAGRLMEADAQTAGHDVYRSGHLYSMPADIYEGLPPQKHLVVAEVDIYGMRRLRERCPDCVTIFVTAPPAVLLERIDERPDLHMDDKTRAQRMVIAREQIQAAKEFDYILFNRAGCLGETVAQVEAIIRAERMRVRHGVDLEAVIPAEAFTQSSEEA